MAKGDLMKISAILWRYFKDGELLVAMFHKWWVNLVWKLAKAVIGDTLCMPGSTLLL